MFARFSRRHLSRGALNRQSHYIRPLLYLNHTQIPDCSTYRSSAKRRIYNTASGQLLYSAFKNIIQSMGQIQLPLVYCSATKNNYYVPAIYYYYLHSNESVEIKNVLYCKYAQNYIKQTLILL